MDHSAFLLMTSVSMYIYMILSQDNKRDHQTKMSDAHDHRVLVCRNREPLGISNVKNSCFVNTALQCVAAALGSVGVLVLPGKLSLGRHNPLPDALHSLWSGEGTTIDHVPILDDLHAHVGDLRNRGDRQEDLQMLVQAIVGDYLGDPVQKLFDFGYNVTVRCPLGGCRASSTHTEAARTLQLSIQEGSSNTLSSLLAYAERPSCMGTKWTHECGGSSPKPYGILTLVPKSYPAILMIQFKRFKQVGGRLVRLDTRITYPVQLNYFTNHPYTLVAVGRHVGGTRIDHGHYLAWVRYGRVWWRCDDEKVERIPNFSVDMEDHARAYMLFYKKIEIP